MILYGDYHKFGTLFGRPVYTERFDDDEEKQAWDARVQEALGIVPQLKYAASPERLRELEATSKRLTKAAADIQWLIDQGLVKP